MAECRSLEITLISATKLPDVRNFGRMKVYAEISLKSRKSNNESTKKTSPPDMENETNPKWDFPVEYTISESSVQRPGVSIVVELYCKRTFGDDRYIGGVNIPIKGLFERGQMSEAYSVEGTSDGKLNLRYSFGDKFTVAQQSSSQQISSQQSSSRNNSSPSMNRALDVFFILLRGAMILLDHGDSDHGDCEGSGGEVHHDWDGEVDDNCEGSGKVFYNAD